MRKDALDGSGRDYVSAKKRALARDDFRCMLCGIYDKNSVKHNRAFFPKHVLDAVGTGFTSGCHILSEFTLRDDDSMDLGHDRKREYAASVLSVLSSFGLNTFVEDMVKQSTINHLSNVLTMANPFRDLFDRLELWLEGTNIPNEHKICVGDESLLMLFRLRERNLRFRAHVPGRDDLPLPDSRLLAIHAACARTMQLSGAAEHISGYDWDAEDLQVLAEDGSSSAVLLEKVKRIAVFSSSSAQDVSRSS
ncbi:uncharacterized protein PHACADRAFT_119804 [Phanerochaete carnosa HHB-10118-sp]|uniref:HNH nuclease domain-containing protein n=1 Tax=Phanerochaete carnosa (strain HHB-10118-sp) TaxID=650164 RepID=K5W720_PHACS|nr:uncharacterized protein PHACADRAFT_119804 [Phanerochaete carnosa HHB-10118-sp]EKM54950.1 hypothetical protein PHACADRAFT_119804 [Phanerochaete carnosa HHB-10118-sp]